MGNPMKYLVMAWILGISVPSWATVNLDPLMAQLKFAESCDRYDVVDDTILRLKLIDDQNPEVLAAIGRDLLRAHKPDEARAMLEKLNPIQKNSNSLRELASSILAQTTLKKPINHAELLAVAGRYQDALSIYDEAFGGPPESPEYQLTYWTWLSHTNTPEAVKRVTEGLLQLKNQHKDDQKIQLAWLSHLAKDHPDEALQGFARLSTCSYMKTNQKNAWRKALARLESNGAATVFYETYLMRFPDDSETRQALADLKAGLSQIAKKKDDSRYPDAQDHARVERAPKPHASRDNAPPSNSSTKKRVVSRHALSHADPQELKPGAHSYDPGSRISDSISSQNLPAHHSRSDSEPLAESAKPSPRVATGKDGRGIKVASLNENWSGRTTIPEHQEPMSRPQAVAGAEVSHYRGYGRSSIQTYRGLFSEARAVGEFGSLNLKLATIEINESSDDVARSDRGISGVVSYQGSQGIIAACGHTPVAFTISYPYCKFGLQSTKSKIDWSLALQRQPITSSVISYAGHFEPESRSTQGGIHGDGLRATLGFDEGEFFGIWSVFDNTDLKGTRVFSNQRQRAMGGIYFRLWDTEAGEFSLGVNAAYWHYRYNMNSNDPGYGDYYSPQRYQSVSSPLDLKVFFSQWLGRIAIAPYSSASSVNSVAHSDEEDTSRSSSRGLSGRLGVEYQGTILRPGLELRADQDGRDLSAMFYVRYPTSDSPRLRGPRSILDSYE